MEETIVPTEKDNLIAEVKQERDDINVKMAEISLKEKQLTLQLAGLSPDFATYLAQDADATKFVELIQSITQNASYVPSERKKAPFDGMTKEKFNLLTYFERAGLYEQNPELVKALL